VDCDPTDDACGWLEVELKNLKSAASVPAFGAKAGQGSGGWTLDVQAHTFKLHLGKVAAWLS
jgi:hypothetical protein